MIFYISSSFLFYYIYSTIFFSPFSITFIYLLNVSDVVNVRKEDVAIRDFTFPYSACSGRLIAIEKVTVHQCKYLCFIMIYCLFWRNYFMILVIFRIFIYYSFSFSLSFYLHLRFSFILSFFLSYFLSFFVSFFLTFLLTFFLSFFLTYFLSYFLTLFLSFILCAQFLAWSMP